VATAQLKSEPINRPALGNANAAVRQRVMKIAIMVRNLGEKGGIGVYTNNLMKALFELDRDNQYVLLHPGLSHSDVFTSSPNVTNIVLPARNKLFWDQVTVPAYADRAGIDIIFNPKLSIPLRARARKVLVMHGAEQFAVPSAFQILDRMYFTLANPMYCKTADAVVVMTQTGKEDVTRYMRADPSKIHVIPEAYNEACRVLPPDATGATLSRYQVPERFMLFIGGLNPIKNFGRALRAFAKLTVGPRHLVVLGFKRWKYKQDLELVSKLNLNDRVHFVGFVPDEDLPAFYNRAELLLFPSLYEGFGIPVLEAMACGCPVVTSTTGCTAEVAGGAAELVDPYDVDSIRAGMERVLTDPGVRRQMIDRGLKRCREFSWKRTAAAMLELFASLTC
jgi:glycosyltransferase involved in cell wall biosynthesis